MRPGMIIPVAMQPSRNLCSLSGLLRVGTNHIGNLFPLRPYRIWKNLIIDVRKSTKRFINRLVNPKAVIVMSKNPPAYFYFWGPQSNIFWAPLRGMVRIYENEIGALLFHPEGGLPRSHFENPEPLGKGLFQGTQTLSVSLVVHGPISFLPGSLWHVSKHVYPYHVKVWTCGHEVRHVLSPPQAHLHPSDPPIRFYAELYHLRVVVGNTAMRV